MRTRSLIMSAMLVALPAAAAMAQQNPPQPQPQPQPQEQPRQPETTPQQQPQQDTTETRSFPGRTPNRVQDEARQHVNRLLEGVTLTAEQRSRVDSLIGRFNPTMGAPNPQQPVEETPDTTRRQPNNPDPTAQQETDYTQLEAQVRSVLTPEQQATWDRNVQARRPQKN